ncbi:Long-chain-fatty-acid--CoA ligase [Fasciola hepatica]|uniref:long-chain-fatty-acid--CoA ligase n=1 Tax=Fasciola hepatica TaxID=6192 RepID=A0A4E0RHC1_FASHE|nr:Long-chain-fatty-acid--CoA ligase [Fasciola hepatica]
MGLASQILASVGIGIIKLVVYTYEYLTWPLYYLCSKTLRYMPLPNSPVESDWTYSEDESRTLALPIRDNDPAYPWRAVESMDGLISTALPGCKDLVSIWLRTVKLWPDLPAFGTRAVLGTDYRTAPDGRRMVELILGEYSWETFGEAERRVSRLAAGLFSMLGPVRERNTPIAIFSETRAEWLYAAQAAFRLSRPVVTLYATLGDDALVHGFNEAEVNVVFTSDELLSKVVKIVQRCPSISRIIYFTNGVFNRELYTEVDNLAVPTGSATASIAEALTKAPSSLHIHDLIEVERRGAAIMLAAGEKKKKNQDLPSASGESNEKTKEDGNHGTNGPDEGLWMPPMSERPKVSDLAVIMYTSGSTGQPKGVELSHENLISAIAGHLKRLPKMRSNYDIYIGYLPLAHVLELCSELCCVIMGVRIGYSNPQTLTDTSSRIKHGACKGDITLLRPTLFASVPTVLERVSKAVWQQVNSSGEFFKALFRFAYDYKCRRIHGGFPSFLVDRLIFRRVRKLMGGRIRYIVSGGAPLSEDSQLFANICLAPIVQGYGLTETSASGALMECGDLRCNHVGAPCPSVQIKLRAWPEGGYSPYDKPSPRGEILIAGGPVSNGYYKQPDLTARDFYKDEDGVRWFCTGDIGLMHTDGSLSIIDRKKDLVKLQAGEYLSLSKVELALSQSSFVEQVCVYANSSQDFAVCFVSPKYTTLMDLAQRLGLRHLVEEARAKFTSDQLKNTNLVHQAELAALCKAPQIIGEVLKDLQRVAREKRLSTFEIPRKLHLDPLQWTPDTGLVTDALKLKRFNLQARFQREIDQMYEKGTRS